MPQFNGVKLTRETIQRTREWFRDNSLACIEEVKNGEVAVNDIDYYFAWRRKDAEDYITGINDNTLTFLQRAHYIQTGESVALLPQ